MTAVRPALGGHGLRLASSLKPATEERARGTGAGSGLIAAALDFCRSAGVDSVFLWPSQRSRALYARHGFVGTGSVMVLALGPPSH